MTALASDWLRHFRLRLWIEFNETWQEARSQRPLPSLCFSRTDRRNKMASDWMRHFRLLLLNRWMEFNETWQEAKSQRPLPSSIGKRRWPPCPLIGWGILDSSSETDERNSTKFDWKKDLNVLYQVCVFGPMEEKRWPPWPLIGWYIFDFTSKTTEQNSKKLDGKQDLSVIWQVFVVRPIGMAVMGFWLAKKSNWKWKYLLFSVEQ